MKKKMLLLIFTSSFALAENTNKNTKTENGRFQLIQLSNFRMDQFMIDSATGRIWRYVCIKGSSDCALGAWAMENVEGVNTDRKTINKAIQNNSADSPKESE